MSSFNMPLDYQVGKNTEDIATANDHIATITARIANRGKQKAITAWGTYGTVGTKITLTESLKNYPYISFIIGYASSGERGCTNMYSTDFLYTGESFTIDCSNASSAGKYMELVVNSNTELEIRAVSTGFAVSNYLRAIYGIR